MLKSPYCIYKDALEYINNEMYQENDILDHLNMNKENYQRALGSECYYELCSEIAELRIDKCSDILISVIDILPAENDTIKHTDEQQFSANNQLCY